jgi:hypothetical protein
MVNNFLNWVKFKFTETFPVPTNIQTFHDPSFEHGEQLSQLGQIQIPTRIHVINLGKNSNLNFP